MNKINQKEQVCNLAGVPNTASAQDLLDVGKYASTGVMQLVRECTKRARVHGGPVSMECIGCTAAVNKGTIEVQQLAQRVARGRRENILETL